MTIDPETTVAQLLEHYRMTADTLVAKLGPVPEARAPLGGGLGARIRRMLENRSTPMSARELAAATMNGRWSRQSVYATAGKMVRTGVIRRPRHGYYEAIRR